MTTEKNLDMRGHACPEPVIQTRKALAELPSGTLFVLVDNDGSAENVRRTAVSLGLSAEVATVPDGDFRVTITKTGNGSVEIPDKEPYRPSCEMPSAAQGTAVFVASSRMGEGEAELGDILMRAFIKTLRQVDPLPTHLIFVNSGVFLPSEGSSVVEDIAALSDAGVQVLVCGTCLDYYHLKDKLKAGRVSNMFDIVSILNTAHHVIRP